MAEETAPSPEQAQTPAAPSPTEQVYKEFGIEETAASFQPEKPATPAQPPAPTFKAPDPFDPNFGAYQAQLVQGVTGLQQSLEATRNEIGTLRQQLNHERTEADIKKAVGSIAEKSGLDPKFTEVAFQLRAKEDPRLLKIWNNRSQNPKALERALEAVAVEFRTQYTVKQDPQLVENQRAVKASQQQMATTTKTGPNEELMGMSPGERQALLRRQFASGH